MLKLEHEHTLSLLDFGLFGFKVKVQPDASDHKDGSRFPCEWLCVSASSPSLHVSDMVCRLHLLLDCHCLWLGRHRLPVLHIHA